MVSTLEQMQVPNGTGPGVQRSTRPLLASRICYILEYTCSYIVQIGKVRTSSVFAFNMQTPDHVECLRSGLLDNLNLKGVSTSENHSF